MIKLLCAYLCIIPLVASAGLPPTTSKVSSDSTNITTFNFQFPNFTGTHTGTTVALGINSVAGGGTGVGTWNANQVMLAGTTATGNFTQVTGAASGNVLTSTGATTAPTWQSAALGSLTTSKASTNTGSFSGSVVINYGSNGNIASGVFTAPSNGLYLVVWCGSSQARAISTTLRVNGTKTYVATGSGGANSPSCGTVDITLATNDTLDVVNQVATSEALVADATFNYFIVTKIGI